MLKFKVLYTKKSQFYCMIINLYAKKRSKIFSEQLIIRMQKKKKSMSPGKLEQEKCTNRDMSEDILGIVHFFHIFSK